MNGSLRVFCVSVCVSVSYQVNYFAVDAVVVSLIVVCSQ